LLNFASRLDKISAQQASKDTSMKAHTHQNTKNNQHTSNTLQKHHFNTSKPSCQRKLATNIYLSTQNQFKCTFLSKFQQKHKIAISEQIELQSESFFLSIEQCFACRKNSSFEDIPSLKASFQQT